ncbi:MAG TPA: serine protease [Pilimelia sp.]|nr:serine protease [Pilimelia sp.]
MRVRDRAGALLGAGIVLGDRHVLTCAHVVAGSGGGAGPGAEVLVDLVGRPGTPSAPAAVLADHWVPPTDDGRGDVALLRLARPLAEPCGAVLRPLSLSWQRPVYTFGFPDRLDDGVYVRALLGGQAGPGREWIQMDAVEPRVPIRQGFSGSGVVDEQTGAVVGMVVSAYTDPSAGLSWMIPVETIVGYLPLVGGWVVGEASIDDSFRSVPRAAGDPATARRIADFFAGQAADNVLVVVAGGTDSAVAVALRRAVTLASRPLAVLPRRGEPPPPDRPAAAPGQAPVPPVGSIDLALDVAGKDSAEVSRRIVRWAGAPPGEPADDPRDAVADAAPRTLVIDGIDEAADAPRLVADVVAPIVHRATERDMRLLLGFRGAAVPARLALLEQRIAQLWAAETAVGHRHARAARRVAGLPAPPARAAELRVRLSALRAAAGADRRHRAGGPPPGDPVPAALARCERATDRALRAARAARQAVDDLLSRHAELGGRLTSERARSVHAGLAEDEDLGALYRAAHTALASTPCDLAAAEPQVHRYVAALRARLDARPEGRRR